MAADLHATLMKLFGEMGRDPDLALEVPLDEWPQESEQWQLLERFRAMTDQVRKRIEYLQQAEKQLREREEQYRSIFEASSDAILIMDIADGHIIEANPAACAVFGYSYEKLIGLLPSAFIHPDQLKRFWMVVYFGRYGGHPARYPSARASIGSAPPLPHRANERFSPPTLVGGSAPTNDGHAALDQLERGAMGPYWV